MWKVYGNVLLTADINGTDKSQAMKFRPNSNIVVRAIRTWFVLYNSPVYTALSLRIYADQGGSAGKLIATSTNSHVPGDLLTTEAYGLKGTYFEFDDIALNGDTWYHVLPYATGYTGTDASHIAWVKGWPDNEYRTGLALDYEESIKSPYRFAVIGAPL